MTKEEMRRAYCREYNRKNKEHLKAYYKEWAKVNRPKNPMKKPIGEKYAKYRETILKNRKIKYQQKKLAKLQEISSTGTKKKQLSRWLLESK